jgi:hypothetical protein
VRGSVAYGTVVGNHQPCCPKPNLMLYRRQRLCCVDDTGLPGCSTHCGTARAKDMCCVYRWLFDGMGWSRGMQAPCTDCPKFTFGSTQAPCAVCV